MTILEAITRIDARRHNAYTREEKLQWLSQLDGKVSQLILNAHAGAGAAFSGYDRNTPEDTPLLVEKPFEELYLYWLEAQICYWDGEPGDYNNAIAQYNRLYGAFAADYRRKHMPRGEGRFVF